MQHGLKLKTKQDVALKNANTKTRYTYAAMALLTLFIGFKAGAQSQEIPPLQPYQDQQLPAYQQNEQPPTQQMDQQQQDQSQNFRPQQQKLPHYQHPQNTNQPPQQYSQPHTHSPTNPPVRSRQGWSPQQQPGRRYQQRPYRRPRYHQSYRTAYNYFKGSFGAARIEDFSDSSGSLTYEESTIMPINLAYGLSSGNIAFEGELGFSAFDYVFDPISGSTDPTFDGDLFASKLMINGMFKTSQTRSNLYLGGGVGIVSVSLDGIEDELVGSALAAQLIVGAELRANERSGLFVEYKHLSSFGLELENDFSEVDFDFKEASLNVGFKLYF